MNDYNFGNLIRVNRICQNISCRSLADMCEIQASQLSKIERGLEKGTDRVVSKLLIELDINTKDIHDHINLLQVEFNDIYLSIVYCKDDARQKLDDFNHKYCSKFESMEGILINFIFFSIEQIKENDFIKMYHILSECINNMTSWQKQLFYEYYGCYLYHQGNYKEAKSYYQKSLDLCVDDINRSMVYYHLACLYEKENDLIEAFSYNLNATKLFNETKNIRRTIYTAKQLGTLHCRLNNFESGIALLDQCIDTMDLIGYNKLKGNVYKKIIWNYIVYNDYQKAQEYLLVANQYCSDDIYYCFYALWIYFKLENKEKAIQYANIVASLTGSTFIKKLAEITKNMVENNKQTIVLEKLETLYLKFFKSLTYPFQEFLLELIISEYSKCKDYEKLYFYSNQLVLLYKNKKTI